MGGKLCDVDIELNGLFCVVDCPKSKLVAAGALWPKELRSEPNGLAKPGVDFDGEEDLDDGRPFRGLIDRFASWAAVALRGGSMALSLASSSIEIPYRSAPP